MFKPTSPEHAATIERLEAALQSIPMGETLSYANLIAVAKCDVRHRHRHLLARARELVEKNLGCCFETIRDVGLTRLASQDVPNVGLAAIRKTRRTAKRGLKRLDRVNGNSLSEPDRRRKIGYSAMLGAIALISDGRKASAVAAVADPTKPIPPENILDMFRQS